MYAHTRARGAQGASYYWNPATNETAWEAPAPAGFTAAPPPLPAPAVAAVAANPVPAVAAVAANPAPAVAAVAANGRLSGAGLDDGGGESDGDDEVVDVRLGSL